jgi:hypothetical protein
MKSDPLRQIQAKHPGRFLKLIDVGVVVAVSVHAVWPAAAPFCNQFMSQTKLWLAGAVVAVLIFGAGIFWTLQTMSIR